MSEPDDAAWIAAAGAPRSDDGPAEHPALAVVPGGTEVADSAPDEGTEDQSAGDQGTADQGTADQGTGGLWAEPPPPPAPQPVTPASNPGVAGSSSPALRAMRGRDPEPAPVVSHGPAIVLAL